MTDQILNENLQLLLNAMLFVVLTVAMASFVTYLVIRAFWNLRITWDKEVAKFRHLSSAQIDALTVGTRAGDRAAFLRLQNPDQAPDPLQEQSQDGRT